MAPTRDRFSPAVGKPANIVPVAPFWSIYLKRRAVLPMQRVHDGPAGCTPGDAKSSSTVSIPGHGRFRRTPLLTPIDHRR